MPTDTRSLYRPLGRRLSIGKPTSRPGVYQSGTESNEPGAYQSPTSGLTMVQTTKPGEGLNNDPYRAGSGGTMTRGGVTTAVAPSPARVRPPTTSYDQFLRDNPNSPAATGSLATPAAPVAAPTTRARPQTESANPLTGDTNASAGGTTQAIDPARALGLSRRGMTAPAGQDAAPMVAPSVQDNIRNSMESTFNTLRGKTAGLSRRQFGRPAPMSPYSGGVSRMFQRV